MTNDGPDIADNLGDIVREINSLPNEEKRALNTDTMNIFYSRRCCDAMGIDYDNITLGDELRVKAMLLSKNGIRVLEYQKNKYQSQKASC